MCNFCLPHHNVENVVCSALSGLIIWKNHRSVMTVLDILHAKNASQTSSVDGVEMMIIQLLANVYMEISQVSSLSSSRTCTYLSVICGSIISVVFAVRTKRLQKFMSHQSM